VGLLTKRRQSLLRERGEVQAAAQDQERGRPQGPHPPSPGRRGGQLHPDQPELPHPAAQPRRHRPVPPARRVRPQQTGQVRADRPALRGHLLQPGGGEEEARLRAVRAAGGGRGSHRLRRRGREDAGGSHRVAGRGGGGEAGEAEGEAHEALLPRRQAGAQVGEGRQEVEVLGGAETGILHL